MKVLQFINNVFAKHPLACNTVSSAVIMATGDAIIQKMTQTENEKLQWERTEKMGFVGGMLGPIQFFIYKNLDKLFPRTDNKTVFRKIIVDQSLSAPIFICAFFFLCNLWEKKPEQSFDEIKDKFIDVYKVDLMIWPAAQYVNFTYVPPQFRVMYVSGITVVYSAFLSYMKHKH
ncbi:mpv17-like protein 2 [Planococcus citri]|uniref:mpv17-like protein 2 n=1 Tax=Planococcus citri TaxID=170843 RepID=UPI0031F80972